MKNKLCNISKITSYKEDVIELFGFFDEPDGVKTIGDFVLKVEKLSGKYLPDEDKVNSFKGDMFEIFSELFFACFHADPDVGLSNYQTVDLEDDYGVDAFGTNPIGDRVAVQCKFRIDPNEDIDWASLAKTYASAVEAHNLQLYDVKPNTIFLITTGRGATDPCHKMLRNKLRVINRRILSGKIDNNKNFWKYAEECLANAIEDLSGDETEK